MDRHLTGILLSLVSGLFLPVKAGAEVMCTKYINQDMKEYSLGSFKGLPDDRFKVIDLSKKKAELKEVLVQLREQFKTCTSSNLVNYYERPGQKGADKFDKLYTEDEKKKIHEISDEKNKLVLNLQELMRFRDEVQKLNSKVRPEDINNQSANVAQVVNHNITETEQKIARLNDKLKKIMKKSKEDEHQFEPAEKWTQSKMDKINTLNNWIHSFRKDYDLFRHPSTRTWEVGLYIHNLRTGAHRLKDFKNEDISGKKLTCPMFYTSLNQDLMNLPDLPDKILVLKREVKSPDSPRWQKEMEEYKNNSYNIAVEKLKNFEIDNEVLIEANKFIKENAYPKGPSVNSNQVSDAVKQLQREYERQLTLNNVYNEALKVEHEKLKKNVEIAAKENVKNEEKHKRLERAYDKVNNLAGAELRIALRGDQIVEHTFQTTSPVKNERNIVRATYNSNCEIKSFEVGDEYFSSSEDCFKAYENKDAFYYDQVKELCRNYLGVDVTKDEPHNVRKGRSKSDQLR